MDWLPTIADRQGPLYRRIVTALADDIAAGNLHPGQALPTHRALARALNVDLTTVTRAYAEAGRQGLTDARVGRGTFVKAIATRPRTAAPGIDLSMNLPPQPQDADLDGRLAKALSDLRAGAGLAPYLTYQQPGGTNAERHAAARWLSARVPGLAADQMVMAPGAQSALFALLLVLCKPGETVLTERLTYPGFKAAAAAVGVRLIGIDMDEEGIVPIGLERTARAHPAARVVYLMPTIHNPTTATMSDGRRARIAEIVRKRRLTLIEDDPYGFLVSSPLMPVSALIPERAYLCASLSKAIAPGFRTALVAAPDAAAATRLANTLRATLQMPAPLMTAVVAHWLGDGTADAIIASVRREATARQELMRAALKGRVLAAHPEAHHVWLPLPVHRPAERFAAELRTRGLAVVTGEAFATDGAPPNAIRLALGAARSRAQLVKALEILSDALSAGDADDQVV